MLQSIAIENSWFALQTSSRSEPRIAELLRHKGFEVLLPLHTNPVTNRSTALFPGYLFCRLDCAWPLPVLTTPGVHQIVGTGRTPTPLSTDELDAIKVLVKPEIEREPWPSLCPGQAVRIVRGPLAGLRATLARVRNEHRVTLNVDLLQRSVLLEVPVEHVTPMGIA